jgi:hypothetical protein
VYPVNVFFAPPLDVIHNFHHPVIVDVANSRISITRYLMVELGYGCRDGVRM